MRDKGTNIVPFGKYKGRLVEELVADKNYTDWLTAQPWLKDRFPAVYQVIINYQPEPAETPEHNAMQIRFLNETFQDAFVRVFNPAFFETKIIALEGYDKSKEGVFPKKTPYVEVKRELSSSLAKFQRLLKFEVVGLDVFLDIHADYCIFENGIEYTKHLRASDKCGFYIEVKPSLSDDYPAVLRQIKQAIGVLKLEYKFVLIVGAYHGIGATWDEVVQMFALAHIKAILMSDIEANLPETP